MLMQPDNVLNLTFPDLGFVLQELAVSNPIHIFPLRVCQCYLHRKIYCAKIKLNHLP